MHYHHCLPSLSYSEERGGNKPKVFANHHTKVEEMEVEDAVVMATNV